MMSKKKDNKRRIQKGLQWIGYSQRNWLAKQATQAVLVIITSIMRVGQMLHSCAVPVDLLIICMCHYSGIIIHYKMVASIPRSVLSAYRNKQFEFKFISTDKTRQLINRQWFKKFNGQF